MEGVGRRGKWHEKAPLGTLLLLVLSLGQTVKQSVRGVSACPVPKENIQIRLTTPPHVEVVNAAKSLKRRYHHVQVTVTLFVAVKMVSTNVSLTQTQMSVSNVLHVELEKDKPRNVPWSTTRSVSVRRTTTESKRSVSHARIVQPTANVTALFMLQNNEKGFLTIAVVGVGVLGLVVVVLVGFITYKSRKKSAKKMLQSPSPPYNVSQESTEILMQTSESSENNCNRSVPLSPVSEQEPSNLPDCVPLEIKIPDMIYAVLDLVPVQQVKQLVRSLGVTDMEIERAETDHRVCKEAHYQMLRVWAERASQAGGGGRGRMLHRPLLQELLDTLGKMHLGQAVEELETKYGIQ